MEVVYVTIPNDDSAWLVLDHHVNVKDDTLYVIVRNGDEVRVMKSKDCYLHRRSKKL